MVELIVAYAKERKDVDYLHVWLSDARNNICECSKMSKRFTFRSICSGFLNQLDSAFNKGRNWKQKSVFYYIMNCYLLLKREEIKIQIVLQ